MKHYIKKSFALLLVSIIIMMSIIAQPFSIQAAESLDLNAESAILVDGGTGKVLYAKNPDVALPPASMTKMMTEYLVLEAINTGEISWDTTTQISDYPFSISANPSFSGVGLTQNKEYTVRELYEAMAIFSDNATTIALAELIAGSEGEFVKLMNQKAEEMNLPEYKFVNTTGLDNESLGDNRPEGTDPTGSNLLSAKSAALLAYHLVNDFPEALEISSQTEVEFEGYTIENLNWMLPHEATFLQQFHYEGMDGLKTGNTELAGYTFTGTAERDGKRLISVVMKTASKEERFQETKKLMDYGFNNFEKQELFPAGHQVEDESVIDVAKGKEDTVDVSLKEAISIPIKPEDAEAYRIKYSIDEEKLNADGKLTAPIEKGEKIGTAELIFEGENNYGYIFSDKNQTVDLVTNDVVEKSNWFMLTLGAIGDFFANLFTTSVDWIKGLFS
ncbi:D-alanyl-D-alanine carboxypeptidase [Virgibacillus profundi]|uniref:serine-type D-Ala-D-Ala carboxypeptidase n=1 Tax=Virgibacillus profundi TaxID=2024555 RepID=A0A2A2IBI3_9BACI|nr:serine hydrolase [Virgibacillus profundi]PAV28505.1 D-alanyl-D-alanine carboxypeptidase [Virgibacillus profundi]PXY52678.1 D-alanyl-D-alanine carboxypeptidase [Virgibacillus profundi]